MVPVKLLAKIIYNGILGGFALVVLNLIGGLFGFIIAVNLGSVLVAGILGVPGVILLIILKYLFP